MNTTTTIKMPPNGQAALLNDTVTPRYKKKTSRESDRKSRKLWWSPKRNHIEIRSEDANYRYDVSSKIRSLDNLDYRPSGGQISIRDEPVHWHAQSKVGSFDNLDYRPTGGQISIRDEPVHWQAQSKVDSLSNANWSAMPSRVAIRSEKVQWNADSKVGSMMNMDYKPAGGDVAIRDDRMDLSHVTPRVDCGFIE
ncbi:hypothetical protein I4U23_007265 [Adineta vaga]|nr:hypothetical protein I4U23_007265 [Adineta vaga]